MAPTPTYSAQASEGLPASPLTFRPGMDVVRFAEALDRARERFLASGEVPTGIRPVIADSWRRSLELGIAADQSSRPVDAEFTARQLGERRHGLLEGSFAVVQRLAVGLAGSETAILVADADGTVLVAHGDAGVMRAAERLGAVAGASWSEMEAGTSGIGTALAAGEAVQVVAGEHYCEGFRSLTCTGVPIRHPFTGQVVGALSFASDYRYTGTLLLPLARESALAIASQMRDHVLRDDQLLLRALTDAGEHQAAYAVDRSGNRTVLNRAASFEIGPADYANIWPLVRRAMSTPDAHRQEYRLENRRRVRLQIRPLEADGEQVGAVVILSGERSHGRHEIADEDWAPFRTDAEGTAAMMRAARDAMHSRSPVLIVGESGTGKSALAVAMHRNRRHGAALTVVDCARGLTAAGLEAEWKLATSGGAESAILLERVDELGLEAQAGLLVHLDQSGVPGPGVLATATAESIESLRGRAIRSDLLDRLAASAILVPPLRDRRDEIPEIARRALHDVPPTLLPMGERIQPDAMQALQSYSWPGNVRQLQNVLRRVLEVRPRQAIHATSLPPEVLASAGLPRRGRIERIELEAILAALAESGGNISLASKELGLSRATLYRRLRAARGRSSAPPEPPTGVEG
jgi:sigma-54 dependent transcriptional regulator, acetoin dehydrogenase operon transcriptional activator AcoR